MTQPPYPPQPNQQYPGQPPMPPYGVQPGQPPAPYGHPPAPYNPPPGPGVPPHAGQYRQAVAVPPRKQNVAGHIAATILTGGLWIPVWFTIRLFARRKTKVEYR